MIKQKVKKVTYQVWEECECGGRLEAVDVRASEYHMYLIYENTCLECGSSSDTTSCSPRNIEEYEEINE